MDSSLALKGFLRTLPPVQHAFAYGSAVHYQPGLYSSKAPGDRPMVDFILSVKDPQQWHSENISMNARHYSWIRYLGPALICYVAQHVGVGVHFNTMVNTGQLMVKYGVISTNDLARDCLSWRDLYIAGRLQKPVTPLVSDSGVLAAQEANLAAAATASLLMMAPSFSTQTFLVNLCGLSYRGDIRMGLAEDPEKVSRIVEGSWQGLCDMYLPLLSQGRVMEVAGLQRVGAEQWSWRPTRDARRALVAGLPENLLSRLARRMRCAPLSSHAASTIPAGIVEAEELPDWRDRVRIADQMTRSQDHMAGLLRASVASIVAASSRRQAIAGLLTAGPAKALAYSARKVAKALKL